MNPQLLNAYTYVGNNPLTHIDPTGEKLVISGAYGVDFARDTFEALREIAPNIHILRSDNDFTIYMNEPKALKGWKGYFFCPETKSELLLQRVIADENTVTIYEGDTNYVERPFSDPSDNLYNGVGVDTSLYFNSDGYDVLIDTFDEEGKTSSPQPRPPFIGLGHELIHALHYIEGTRSKGYSTYTGLDGRSYRAKIEEIRTVGLDFNPIGDVTENDLRKEKHMKERNNY